MWLKRNNIFLFNQIALPPKWKKSKIKICSIPNCNEKHSAKGFCIYHYHKFGFGKRRLIKCNKCKKMRLNHARNYCDNCYWKQYIKQKCICCGYMKELIVKKYCKKCFKRVSNRQIKYRLNQIYDFLDLQEKYEFVNRSHWEEICIHKISKTSERAFERFKEFIRKIGIRYEKRSMIGYKAKEWGIKILMTHEEIKEQLIQWWISK